MGDRILERTAELRAISCALNAARSGRGRVIVVEGSPGIGKSALIGRAQTLAGSDGLRVLTGRGAELERTFPFGVARQLLEPAVHPPEGACDPTLLAGPARLAAGLLDVVDDGRPPGQLPPGPDGALAAVHALWWLIVNLSRLQPVALVIDDAHWSDQASLRLLSYASSRIADVPVALIVAMRPGRPGGDPLLSELVRTEAAEVLRPAPLTPVGGAQLVRHTVPSADDDLCATYHAATGGNPLLLTELVRSGRERLPPAGGLAAPQAVVEEVLRRVGQGPGGSLVFSQAIAVLGRDVSLRHAAALAGISIEVAAGAADGLAELEVLHHRRPLEFRHPIIATAIADHIPLGERAATHARAARLLSDEGAAPERVGAHLIDAEPRADLWTCEQLCAAARDAGTRGAPEVAVRYLRRALAEPPPRETRAETLVELGAAEALSLEIESAIDHLSRGLEQMVDPDARLGGTLLLAGLFTYAGRFDELVKCVETSLEFAERCSPSLVAQAEANLLTAGRSDARARRSVTDRAARVLGRVLSGEEDAPPLLAAASAELAAAGESAERVAQLADRALLGLDDRSRFDWWPYIAVRSLAIAGRPAEAHGALGLDVAEARDLGCLYQLRALLIFRADAALRTGFIAEAEADAREAKLLIGEDRWDAGLSFAVAILVLALVERGQHDAAADTLASAGLDGPALQLLEIYPNNLLLHSRGRLRLAVGDLRAGVDDLLECGRRQLALGEVNPASLDWRSQAALGLSQLGDDAEARELAREELKRAEHFAAPGPIGVAKRAVGLLEDSADGLEWLQQAVATLAPTPAGVEHARALVDLGAGLRRTGRQEEAVEALRAGMDGSHRCGASALEDRAMVELRAAGARPRRPALNGLDSLTEGEHRVADRAASGLTNREIAATLHLSVRTVEFHLSNVYRKLGVRRPELPRALASVGST